VIAAAGAKCRELRNNPEDLKSLSLPQGFTRATIAMPGVLLVEGPTFEKQANFADFKASLACWEFHENYPWISVIDEGTLDTNNVLSDFLWLTFTRSAPAQDIYGIKESVYNKHWKCEAPLIIDARIKPHHQKQLTIPAEITNKAKQILKDAGVQ
jgi:4-hydroxy-3-polyprenylbenzoate decarboxylase